MKFEIPPGRHTKGLDPYIQDAMHICVYYLLLIKAILLQKASIAILVAQPHTKYITYDRLLYILHPIHCAIPHDALTSV